MSALALAKPAKGLLFSSSTGGGGGGGSLSVTLGINNTSAGSLSAGLPVSVGHAFKKGDVPSGSYVTSSGITTLQQDRQALYSDGSLRYAVFSFISPSTFTANQTQNYTFASTVGTPPNTAFITLAQLSAGATINSVVFPATDFKLKFYQGDLGATDVFHVGVNDIITNGTNFPWGSNPVQGWEIIRAGPVCCEWKFWGFLKRDSDSKFHRWVRATIWVRVWNQGNYEVAALVCQPNCYGAGANANQTVGNASTAVKVSCFSEFYNGATLLQAYGGPSDSRTFTFANTAIDTTNSTFSLTGGQAPSWGRAAYGSTVGNAYYGLGGIFSTTGTLPSGLSANTVYWPTQYASPSVGTAFRISSSRFGAMNTNTITPGVPGGITNADFSSAAVTITTQGTGTHTITPVMTTFQQTGWMALDSTAQPLWVGSGSKPPFLPVHDRTYLTRQAHALSYYDWTSTQYVLQASPQTHQAGLPVWLTFFGQSGESSGDERINPAGGHSAIMALYNQTDIGWGQQSRILAAGFVELPQFAIDEQAGQPVVCNSGPDRAGGNYTNLAATNPTFRSTQFGGWSPAGSPKVALTPSTAQADVYGQQISMYDGSHQPAPWMIPYLRSGDDWWLESGKHQICAVLANSGSTTRNETISAVNYGGVLTDPANSYQLRGIAWNFRTGSFCDYVMPSVDPIHAYIKDCIDDSVAFLPNWGATQSASKKALGAYNLDSGVSHENEAAYQLGMLGVVFGLEALRGERSTNIMSFYNNYLHVSVTDPWNSDLGGLSSEYWCGVYWWEVYSTGTTYYTSFATWLSANFGTASPSGTGFASDAGPAGVAAWMSFTHIVGGSSGFSSDATSYVAIHRAAMASWAANGAADAAAVLGRINTRITGIGGMLYSDAGTSTGYPDWNILSS